MNREDQSIEEKIENLTKQVRELQKENEKLKRQINSSTGNKNGNLESYSNEEISRREFLKGAGTGALGLTALAFLPSASAFNIKSSNPLQYFNSSRSSNPNFKVNSSGDILGNKADVTELIANSVAANQELQLPDQQASENKKIWVEEVDSNVSELRVRLQGQVKTIGTGATLADTLIENFEDHPTNSDSQPYGPYQSGDNLTSFYSKYGSDEFTRQSGVVQSGNYALEWSDTTDSYDNAFLISQEGDGLPRYIQRGDTFQVWLRDENGSEANRIGCLFGVQDSNNYYSVELQTKKDVSGLFISQSGSRSQLASGSSTYSSSTWYLFEVSWSSDDSISVTVYDSDGSTVKDSFSVTDSTFSDQTGVGWYGRGGTGMTCYADSFEVIE